MVAVVMVIVVMEAEGAKQLSLANKPLTEVTSLSTQQVSDCQCDINHGSNSGDGGSGGDGDGGGGGKRDREASQDPNSNNNGKKMC